MIKNKSKNILASTALLACIAAFTLMSAACTSSNSANSKSAAQGSGGVAGADTSQPNPFVTCKNIEEAEALAGLELKLPEKIEGYDKMELQVIPKEMIEVVYTKDNHKIVIRKGINNSETDGDVSGDHTEYTNVGDANVGEVKVTFKGDDEKDPRLAVWTVGSYAYSLSSDELERSEFNSLISDIQ